MASTAEGTGGSGGVEPSFRETCERLYGAILEVTTELGCPHEEDVRYTCDPLLYEACLPEKTLQFGCLADWTTIERCSCGSGSGGEGGDDGFQCAWPCEGLGAAVEEACPTPSEE